MADLGQKIGELPAASTLDGDELIPVVQDGATKKSTAAAVETLVKDSLSKADVGLGNVANERQYSAQNPPPTPTAADVGAIPANQKGVAGGVAELDNSGKVPTAQLPSIPTDAEDISYDNTVSSLSGDNVQEALDELAAGKQDTLTFDTAPTEDSLNPVTSGGVYDAIIGLLPTDIVSGDPANFPDGYPAPVLSLAVDILPAQEGTGDPSPSNVRPIYGRTGLTLYHSGEDTTDYDSLAVSWENEAGAIYGGTLDLQTGILTVTKKLVTVGAGYSKGSITSVRQYGTDTGFWLALGADTNTVADKMQNRCNQASPSASVGITSGTTNQFGAAPSYPYSVWVRLLTETVGTTVDSVHAYITAHPLEFAVGLAQPVQYYLTPRELRTLLGENNIWATSGPVEVEYHADIMRYILKQLPAAQGTLSLSRPALTLGAVSEPEGVVEDEPE